MSIQSEGKDAKGRNYYQSTKDGTGSAASVGTGGTGDIGRMSGDAGNAQSATRTDDWLSDGSERERKQGFRPSEPGAIETGMEGIGNRAGGAGNQHKDWGHSDVGAGNRQSESRLDDVVGSDTGAPAEEAGELQTGFGGIGSLSTGNAGSRQSADETPSSGQRNRR